MKQILQNLKCIKQMDGFFLLNLHSLHSVFLVFLGVFREWLVAILFEKTEVEKKKISVAKR
jgi:hypothetical protein